MQQATRYVEIKAIEIDKVLHPIWEFTYHSDDNYLDYYLHPSSSKRYTGTIECYYDLSKHKLFTGFIVDSYPESCNFKIGEEVFYAKKLKYLTIDKIKDIFYNSYDSIIKRYKNFDSYEKRLILNSGESFDDMDIVELRIWKPFYLLESGKITEWEHELYHKE